MRTRTRSRDEDEDEEDEVGTTAEPVDDPFTAIPKSDEEIVGLEGEGELEHVPVLADSDHLCQGQRLHPLAYGEAAGQKSNLCKLRHGRYDLLTVGPTGVEGSEEVVEGGGGIHPCTHEQQTPLARPRGRYPHLLLHILEIRRLGYEFVVTSESRREAHTAACSCALSPPPRLALRVRHALAKTQRTESAAVRSCIVRRRQYEG